MPFTPRELTEQKSFSGEVVVRISEPQDASLLADFLASNPALSALKIKMEKGVIDADFLVTAIASSFQQNFRLERLDLSDLAIVGRGYFELAAALKNNSTLCRVELPPLVRQNEIENFCMRNDCEVSRAASDYCDIALTARIATSLNYVDLKKLFSPRGRIFLTSLAKNILFEGLSHSQILELSQQWHHHMRAAHREKIRSEGGQITWPSLFGKDELIISDEGDDLAGCRIVALTNREALQEEARAMGNCSRSYYARCAVGNFHVLSIRDKDGSRLSTSALAVDYETHEISVLEHVNARNEKAEGLSVRLLQWLLKNSEQMIDFSSLADRLKHRASGSGVSDEKTAVTGFFIFNPFDERTMRKVITQYRRNVMPKEFRSSFDRMLAIDVVDLTPIGIGTSSGVKITPAPRGEKASQEPRQHETQVLAAEPLSSGMLQQL